MRVLSTALHEVMVVEPRVFEDRRGFFFESYNARAFADVGITVNFVQDNQSCSVAGTIRGFHYQLEQPQAKLVRVVRGAVFDVAVDIRRRSSTFGQWVGIELSADNKRQLFIPTGFAHAFCVLGDLAEVQYKCSDFYLPTDQHGIIWNDPAIGVRWPVENPVLSEKDLAYAPLTPARVDLPDAR